MRENKARWSFAATGALVIGLVSGLVFQAAPADAGTLTAGSRTTARWIGAVDTSSRAAVNAAYWNQYAAYQDQKIGWIGGSVLGCLLGLTSSSTNKATQNSLNFVRSMAGLAPVTFDSTLNAQAQRTALMMAANKQLSHYPTSDWLCYSSTGAKTASLSNLALAWPEITAGGIVDMYMDDRGDSNTAVGHRRWLLNPFTTKMGSGSTDTANALVVVGPTSASRPNPRYVPWPTAGYFPRTIEPDQRWSLSAGLKSVSFRDAKVKVWHRDRWLKVRKYSVHDGYAQPTLVWHMPKTNERGAYRVVVTNIKKSGSSTPMTFRYKVRLFQPTN